MDKNKQYGSRFLYAEDLLIGKEFKSPVVKISEVHKPGSLKSADGRTIDKWTIGFEGKEKLLVLAKTNSAIVHFLTGELPGNDWVGHNIRLEARIVDAFGAETTAIRVMPPIGATLRKTLIDRLGRKAVYKDLTGGPNEQPEV